MSYLRRFRIGWATIVAVAVVLLGTFGAWAALRDVAHRLEPQYVSVDRETSTSPATAVGSDFSAGPTLGDLQDLIAGAELQGTIQVEGDGGSFSSGSFGSGGSSGVSARSGEVTSGHSTTESTSISGSGDFSTSQGDRDSGRSSGGRSGGRSGGGGGSSDGSQICGLPAMC